jgi:hypothetical protein
MGMIEFHAIVKNGFIEIPTQYRGQVKNRVRVILVPESEKSQQPTFIDQLLDNPIKVEGFAPMRRDDLHER